MRRQALFVRAVLAACDMASAEVVATCGASKGCAYFIPGPVVPKDKAGWTEDGVTGGSLQLIRNGNNYDIVYTDVSGGTVSSKAEGATVIAERSSVGDVVLLLAYDGAMETFVFWVSQPNPTVSFSQAKFGSVIQKHSLMVAPCRRGP